MRAGKLDRRIVLQAFTTTQDGYGEENESWSTFATVWAQVMPFTGRERFVADQVSGEADTRFRIRWRSDIDVTQRIVYDGDTYDIEGVIEIGRHEGLEILAKALVPA